MEPRDVAPDEKPPLGPKQILRSHAIFALVIMLCFVSIGAVPAVAGAAIWVLVIAAVFAYGAWVGSRWRGKSLQQYALMSFSLALCLWLGNAVVLLLYGATSWSATLSVVIFGTLLCTGGAVLGDLAVRRELTVNSALIGLAISVAGLLVSIVQLFA